MSVALFQPSDLNNVWTLRKKLFTGEPELAKLDAPASSDDNQSGAPLFPTRLKITWLTVTLPFQMMYAIFLRMISSLLSFAGCNAQRRSIAFEAQLAEVKAGKIIYTLHWGNQLVLPSCNTYKPEACYLTEFQAIPRENLKSYFIQKHLTQLFDQVQFDLRGKGLCSGSTDWFNYLLLLSIQQKMHLRKTAKSFKEYMTKIASHFTDGQPIQAALLQSLYGVSCPLLGIIETRFQIPTQQLQSRQTLVESLNAVPNGLYHIRIMGIHSMSFLKADEELLLFDPNVGLIELHYLSDLASTIESYTNRREIPVYFCYQELENPGLLTRVRQGIWSRVFG